MKIGQKQPTTNKPTQEVNPAALGKAGNNAIQLMCAIAGKSVNYEHVANYLNVTQEGSAQVYKDLTKAIYKLDKEITEEIKDGKRD